MQEGRKGKEGVKEGSRKKCKEGCQGSAYKRKGRGGGRRRRGGRTDGTTVRRGHTRKREVEKGEEGLPWREKEGVTGQYASGKRGNEGKK
jgi:hypothetical protein